MLHSIQFLLSLIFLDSILLTNHLVYAQLLTGTQDHTTPISPPARLHQQPLHLVKITSPQKGQHVSVDKDLVIYGSSADNATASDCKVSIIVNGIKPYQHTTPSGSHGQNNYSKWNFTLTTRYTNIKEGQNKISAKFSCANNPSLVAHNSVNVTGVMSTIVSLVATNKDRSNNINNNNNNNDNNGLHSNHDNSYIENNNHPHNQPLTIISIPHIHIPNIQIPLRLPFH